VTYLAIIAVAIATGLDLYTTRMVERAGGHESNWFRWLPPRHRAWARIGVSVALVYLATCVWHDPTALGAAAACWGCVALWNWLEARSAQ
jgi:hypothetical protein